MAPLHAIASGSLLASRLAMVARSMSMSSTVGCGKPLSTAGDRIVLAVALRSPFPLLRWGATLAALVWLVWRAVLRAGVFWWVA